MPKTGAVLFAAICALAVGVVIYFAHSAAVQSVPAYSTLNTGPDGAKLLFDGLEEAGYVRVSRQFRNIALQKPHNSTVFFLGTDPFDLIFADQRYFDEMEKSASSGNRLVVTITDRETIDLFSMGAKPPHDLADRWGITFLSNKGTHTSSIIVDKNWQALPAHGPNVWQRNFGKGSIIVAGQTQRLNNKGVATSVASRNLLHKLVSGYPSAVFEEEHLGIRETGSIMGLARHYHLQGLLAGLILVAALFVWNRSVSFPPTPAAREKILLGSDSRSMLAELMSRHLKGQLIATCVAEWNRTRAHAPALAVPAERDTVTAYTKLQETLREKTEFRI